MSEAMILLRDIGPGLVFGIGSSDLASSGRMHETVQSSGVSYFRGWQLTSDLHDVPCLLLGV